MGTRFLAGRRCELLAGAVVVVAGLLAAWWVLAAGRVANDGFDITDEGYYLLSYRWWNSHPLALTGVQYLYGPVFEWLGYDVAHLRLFRLATVVVVHLLFGYSFMRWLRGRRPSAPPSRLWELAGMAVILAAGGMVYSWLPLTPGYNDVVLLGALTLSSCVLWMATAIDRGRRVPAWLLIVAGIVIGVMVLAKWSSVVVIGLAVVAALIDLSGQGPRAVVRGVLLALAGLGLVVLCVQLFVVPLDVAVPGILAVNRFIAGTSYSPADLLQFYWSTTMDMLGRTLRDHGLLMIAAVLLATTRQRRLQLGAGVLAMAGLGISIWRIVVEGGALGGTQHKEYYAATLTGALLVTVVTGVAAAIGRRRAAPAGSRLNQVQVRGWAVLGLLVLLPMVQAFGTNTPLYGIGVNAFAAWAAVMIAMATGLRGSPYLARALVAVVTTGALVAVASIAYTSLFLYPYRSVEHGQLTAAARLPALKGLHIAPGADRNLTKLAGELRTYTDPAGRPMLALDKMAGIVFALQGRPVGEAWVSPNERPRTVAGIREVCKSGAPWNVERPPVLLLKRDISAAEIDALRSCGVDIAHDYRLLAPPKQTIYLQVWVPKREPSTG